MVCRYGEPLTLSDGRIGFVVVRRGVNLSWDEARPYRGLDRLPWTLNPLELGDDHIGRLWRAYEDAWEEGRIGRDRDEAERICGQLNDIGADVELIYADIAVQPVQVGGLSDQENAIRDRRMEWLAERSKGVPLPPPNYTLIGLDVCSPIPSFHSVIFQPGLGFPHDTDFAAHLNEHGLIAEDVDYATDLMNRANQGGYLLSSFHVVRVLACR